MKTLSGSYYIYSHEHRAWWRPARNGYTDSILEAGMYSLEEANEICITASYGSYNLAGTLPEETMLPIEANKRIILNKNTNLDINAL